MQELDSSGLPTNNSVKEIECQRNWEWITNTNATFQGNRAIENKYIATFLIVSSGCGAGSPICLPKKVYVPFNLTTYFFINDNNMISLYNQSYDNYYTYPKATVKWTIDMGAFPFENSNGQLNIEVEITTKTV